MSRTVAFGRDVLNESDVDIEDLLACLSPTEVQAILDELAGDPDDKHVHPSVRNSYRCEKDPTGSLDRHSLISYINQEALTTPDEEEQAPFEAGMKRGKVFSPTFTSEEMKEMQNKADIAEKVKLEPDEEEALTAASLDDIMALADILNTNPQNFIMEAYSDPLKYYPPDPPNTTEPREVLERLSSDDQTVKDVNLNNVAGGMEEQQMCDLFDTLRNNKNLTKLSVVNCDINDFAVSTLCLALEENRALKSLNLEGNKISPDTLASLFESLASGNNGLVEVRVAGQQQEKMGHRVESRIADAIVRNPRLLKCGIKFEFREVMNRVSRHLIRNVDKIRRKRKAETLDLRLGLERAKDDRVMGQTEEESDVDGKQEERPVTSVEEDQDLKGDTLNLNSEEQSDNSSSMGNLQEFELTQKPEKKGNSMIIDAEDKDAEQIDIKDSADNSRHGDKSEDRKNKEWTQAKEIEE